MHAADKTGGSARSDLQAVPELEDFRRAVTTTTHSKRMNLIIAVRDTVHAESGTQSDNDFSAHRNSLCGATAIRHKSTLGDIREEDSFLAPGARVGVGWEEPEPSSALMRTPQSAGSSGGTGGLSRRGAQLRPIRVRSASVDGSHPQPPPPLLPHSNGATLFSEKSGPITADMLEQRKKFLPASIPLEHHCSADSSMYQSALNPVSPVTGPSVDFCGNRSPVSSGNPLAPAPLQRLPTPPSGALSASASASGHRTFFRSTGNSRTNAPLSPNHHQRPTTSPFAAESPAPLWAPPACGRAPPPVASTCLARSFSWPYDHALAALDFQGRSRMRDGISTPEGPSVFFACMPHATLARQRQAVNTRYALLHKRLMTTCMPLPKCACDRLIDCIAVPTLGLQRACASLGLLLRPCMWGESSKRTCDPSCFCCLSILPVDCYRLPQCETTALLIMCTECKMHVYFS
jgi:hypothetical protein